MTSKSKKKTTDFIVRPRAATETLPVNSDQWVSGVKGDGEQAAEQAILKQKPLGKQKRLTLNLPAEQHTAFKGRCVVEGVTIQDKVQELIDGYLATVTGNASTR